jgi:hypothetical protein
MPAFDDGMVAVSDGTTEIRLECLGNAAGTEGLWWVAEGYADGSNKPKGLFHGKEQAEELAKHLAQLARVPLRVKG